MLKIIKMEYFDQFQCLMDKCSDNCCEEKWSISIDEETYQKYVNMNLAELDMKIRSTAPHTIIKKSGKCPFMTENGLCSVHKDYGEELLSNTCRTYPRFVSEFGNLYIENLGLSCPAVAQWIVSLNYKCKLIEQVYYEDATEFDKKFVQTEAELLMKMIIDPFYKNDSLIDSFIECYRIFEVKGMLPLDSEFNKTYSLLLQNISICYLFERIMLQSKMEEPDYVSVIERLCYILIEFEKWCSQTYSECTSYTQEQLYMVLYRVMRLYDHEI